MKIQELYQCVANQCGCDSTSPRAKEACKTINALPVVNRNSERLISFFSGPCKSGDPVLATCERKEAQYGTIDDGSIVRIE